MAYEDNIANDIRADIRELRAIEASLYILQQRVIDLGYSVVDNAQSILLAPPALGAQNDAAGAAALTLQALNAQTALVTAQNDLYNIWVNYQISRLGFYTDLELTLFRSTGVMER